MLIELTQDQVKQLSDAVFYVAADQPYTDIAVNKTLLLAALFTPAPIGEAVALRDALLERYPVEVTARIAALESQVAEMRSVYDAVRRLEAWNDKTWHFYTIESYSNGIPGHAITLSREGRRLTESFAETLAAAINVALDAVEGEREP